MTLIRAHTDFFGISNKISGTITKIKRQNCRIVARMGEKCPEMTSATLASTATATRGPWMGCHDAGEKDRDQYEENKPNDRGSSQKSHHAELGGALVTVGA